MDLSSDIVSERTEFALRLFENKMPELVARMRRASAKNPLLVFVCIVTLQYEAEAYTRPLAFWIPGATRKHELFFKEAYTVVEAFICRGVIDAQQAQTQLQARFEQC
jgi:hypothetical protein